MSSAPTARAPKLPESKKRSRVRRVGMAAGSLCLVLGLVALGSVAWQLWGTGIATAHAQHKLAKQFDAAVSGTATGSAPREADSHPAGSSQDSSAPADVVPTPATTEQPAALGSLVGHLVIPKIGVNDYIVEGVGSAQLADGPGHYPGTAPIGWAGNVGIAGHRTTHAAPFYNLNELQPGDQIYLTNLTGRTFTYRVVTQFVVQPSDSAVLDRTSTPTLTLTTCNPRYSASQRLIVQASLVGAPASAVA